MITARCLGVGLVLDELEGLGAPWIDEVQDLQALRPEGDRIVVLENGNEGFVVMGTIDSPFDGVAAGNIIARGKGEGLERDRNFEFHGNPLRNAVTAPLGLTRSDDVVEDIVGAFAPPEVPEVVFATGFDTHPVPIERAPVSVHRNVPFNPVILGVGQVPADQGCGPGAEVVDDPDRRPDIGISRIAPQIDLGLVVKTVSIGVLLVGIGAEIVGLRAVIQSIAIAVRISGVSPGVGGGYERAGVCFGSILKSVAVGVRVVGIGAVVVFRNVVNAVHVQIEQAIVDGLIETVPILVGIRHAILIGIRKGSSLHHDVVEVRSFSALECIGAELEADDHLLLVEGG